MRKKLLCTAALILIIPFAASVNLQTNAETPDRVLYPNETVEVNLSVENLDTRAAENTSILLEVGERKFEYDAGDIEAGEEFNKTLELPEFPAGSYQAKAAVNYTGFLGERFTETTRSGFKVRFPDFVRIPRQVYIQDLSIPDNVTAGDEEIVNAVVNHDGDIEGDFTAAVVSKDARTEKEFALSPGSQRNLSVQPTFYSPGVSFAETRLYANIDDDLFLLDYLSEQVFVQESRIARINVQDLTADKQDSSADIQLDLINNGSSTAYEVNVSFSSGDLRKISQEPEVSLLNSGEKETINIEVANPKTSASEFRPSLSIRYRDGRGYHTVERNLTLSLNATAADIAVREVKVDESGETPVLSYLIENNGEERAENIEVELNSEQGIAVENPSDSFNEIDPEERESGEIGFSVLKSTVENLELNLTASYQTEAGTEKTRQESTTLEGGYSEGAVCSYDYQCGTSSNPMSCSSTPAGGDSRCCPSGESYSSSAGKCLEKLTFVAVPLHYESNEFSRFKRNVKEQVNGWLEVSPLRETENPRNRVEIFYLQPSEIDEEGKKNLCKLIDVTYDEVVESEYRNEFDKAIGVSDESAGNYGGCASLPGDAEVTLDSSPESFYQEIAHNYGLEHTQDHSVMGSEPGCGAERFDEDEPNNPKSDGPAEIMNYCPGDEYYSQSSDEYDILKQRLIENGYM